MVVTRFAPSPNGPLHLGHAFSAIAAHDLAKARGGRFVLRIEDIDGARSRPELADQFRADLAWLGLEWDEVARQSARIASYEAAARRLREAGLLYPCRCTRAEIAGAAVATGPDGPVYPGTCRSAAIARGEPVAWRLDVGEALRRTGPLSWIDERKGEQRARPELAGVSASLRTSTTSPANSGRARCSPWSASVQLSGPVRRSASATSSRQATGSPGAIAPPRQVPG